MIYFESENLALPVRSIYVFADFLFFLFCSDGDAYRDTLSKNICNCWPLQKNLCYRIKLKADYILNFVCKVLENHYHFQTGITENFPCLITRL